MTITLNGTSGIVNDATDLNYTGTLTGGTGVVNLGSGQVYKDASGNVGVGVVPSASWGTYKVIQLGEQGVLSGYATGAGVLNIGANFYWDGSGYKYLTTNPATLYQQNAGSHNWRVAASGTADAAISFNAAMTLDSSGNLLVGTTSGTAPGRVSITTATDGNGLGINGIKSANSNYYLIGFRANGSVVGDIYSNGSTTTYATTSDYRLKENVQPMAGALAKVAALKPCTYTWTNTGLAGQGFLAHELQVVEPDCVGGEKDAVDADGNPQYQGIDTSFLVATLAAAIQELKAVVDEQATRITALEGTAA